MTIPAARYNTYVNGTSELDGEDLNKIQDNIIELGSGCHLARTRQIPASLFASLNWSHIPDQSRWASAAGGDTLFVPLELDEGETITGFGFYATPDAAGAIAVDLREKNLTTEIVSTIAAGTPSSGSSFAKFATSGLAVPVAAEVSYFLRITAAQAGDWIFGAYVTTEKPDL